MAAGKIHDRLQQGLSNATAPVGPRNVEAPDATHTWIVGIGIAVQSADADHLATRGGEK